MGELPVVKGDRVYVRIAFIVLALVWPTTWLVIKISLEGAPPLLGASVRFMVAGGCFAIIWTVLGRSLRLEPAVIPQVLLTGTCLFALPYGLLYVGETRISSGLAAVLSGALPLFAATFAHRVLPDEPFTMQKGLGITIGLVGLVVIFHGGIALSSGLAATLAIVGVASGSAFSALGQVVNKRWAGTLQTPVLLAWAMCLGGLLLLAGAAVSEPLYITPNARTVGSIMYLAVAGSVLPFGLMIWLLKKSSAFSVSLLSLALPVIALWEGWAFYNEQLNAWIVFGAGVVGAGVCLSIMNVEWFSLPRRIRTKRIG